MTIIYVCVLISERLIFKETDLCVTTGLSINGRLFVTPKEHLDALVTIFKKNIFNTFCDILPLKFCLNLKKKK